MMDHTGNSSNAAPASKVKPVGLIGDASTVLSFVDATNGGKEGAKVETQGNEKSSSDMHQDENKLVHKRSDKNLVLPEEPHLAPKSVMMRDQDCLRPD
ncbi:hypothetical protein Tco_1154957 [Tanacetum coccineum]